jgi:hypothetical protein
LGASVEEMVNMAAIAVIDAQEKQKKKNKHSSNKSTYSIGSAFFINYKQSIFRQNTNQSNDSTFTRQVSRKNTNTCYY